jgi:hypothetical protein
MTRINCTIEMRGAFDGPDAEPDGGAARREGMKSA